MSPAAIRIPGKGEREMGQTMRVRPFPGMLVLPLLCLQSWMSPAVR